MSDGKGDYSCRWRVQLRGKREKASQTAMKERRTRRVQYGEAEKDTRTKWSRTTRAGKVELLPSPPSSRRRNLRHLGSSRSSVDDQQRAPIQKVPVQLKARRVCRTRVQQTEAQRRRRVHSPPLAAAAQHLHCQPPAHHHHVLDREIRITAVGAGRQALRTGQRSRSTSQASKVSPECESEKKRGSERE